MLAAAVMLGVSAAMAACSDAGGVGGAAIEPVPSAVLRGGALGEEGGLEVLTLPIRASDREFAGRMTRIAGGMAPMPSELERLWNEHGLRVIAVATAELPAALATLGGEQSGGGRGSGAQQQWLGQSPSWIEVARGPLRSEGAVVSLDVERIRLPAGSLRLLTRTWLEPVPPSTGDGPEKSGAPGAVLRIDLVPQHMEDRAAAAENDPLGINLKSIAAEEQGLLFRRLLARLSVGGEQAYLIVSERPGVDWARAAQAPEPAAESPAPEGERTAPKVGQVVRSSPRATAGAAPATAEAGTGGGAEPARAINREESAGGEWGALKRSTPVAEAAPAEKPAPRRVRESRVSGPSAPRVPTVGEAMLGVGTDGVRTVVVLVPRVPREFSLTPGR